MGLLRLLKTLGPGLLLAATSIGGSHLVLATSAGARFGTELLWLVLVAHLFKYHAFEYGPRLAMGADMSLLEGYRRLPGPRNWALWVGVVDMVLESVGVLAAVAGLTGAILHAAFGGLTLPAWTGLSLLGVFLMLRTGRYRLLVRTSLLMLVLMVVGTAVAFLGRPPSAGQLVAGLAPSLPTGSLLLVSAILGWMPTGVGVSIWHSLWIREDPRFALAPGDEGNAHARRRRFRDGIRDMRIGYALSAIVGVLFLCLGAMVLHPRGLVPEGAAVATTLAELYADVLGAFMAPAFLCMAFFAMFSTTYTVMDGMPRTLVAAWRHIRGEDDADRPDRGGLYWGYLVAMTVGALLIVRAVPDPVLLITVLGAITLVFSPVYFVLNIWCVEHFVRDEGMRPSRTDRWLSRAGALLMAGTALLVLYTEVWLRLRGG